VKLLISHLSDDTALMAVHAFCHKGCVISEMTRDGAIVTAERQ